MEEKKRKANRKVLITGVIILICAMVGLILLFWAVYRVHHVPKDKVREADVAALAQGDHEAVLMSMYSAEEFEAEEFMHFRGTSAVQAFHNFVNLADIGDYLDKCFSGNMNLTDVYIGLDPYVISGLYGHHTSLYVKDYENYLTSYIQAHNDVVFEFLLPVYSVDYLRTLSDSEYNELVNSYRNLANIYLAYDNVIIYYLGYEDWLIMNPGNYDGSNLCKQDVLYKIVAYTFWNSFYYLTSDNMEERFARMTELVQQQDERLDLSEWSIVFFGDSVMAYHTGSLSISGVVSGLSGAETYNCGEGGMPATEVSFANLSFNRMVTRFLEQDTAGLDEDSNYLKGLTEYMQTEHEGKKCCFVVEFGLNDYFNGHAVENPEDQYDTGTYAGALRTGIRSLQDAYPEAEILLLTPTYTILFSGGTEINSEIGGTLTDYVDATLRVAEEMNVYCLDNYADSGINAYTSETYLADGTHPNESGSLLLGNSILEYIGRIMTDEE